MGRAKSGRERGRRWPGPGMLGAPRVWERREAGRRRRKEEGKEKKRKKGKRKNGEKEKGREREKEIAPAGFAAATVTGRARAPVGRDARNEEE